MTSTCIFKDTLRNHTQVFLRIRNSILRFAYISFNFNCTLDFLPSIDAEQRRREHQRKSRFRKMDSRYPQYRSLYQSSFIKISCFNKYSSKLLQFLRCHHSTQLILMFFMWSNRPMTKAYPDPIRRLSLTPQRY